MKWKDLSVLIAVIMVVMMMVVPMPTLLLDFLLIINISLALAILMVAMNTKEPLQFSIFPSLLLLTTLFRLSLNVSTTRSILSKANGGEVVQAFGTFVIGGNAVIGFVVFLILIIINFIVITKGSERVAEVAARFTLDAMPGKQMSIDADLNAGMISDIEARERRRVIEREADFYGAMDGASKFVKGDAIAGIIILIINVFGGFIIGMVFHGMDFKTSANTFTLLSVGDGLVSSIPALLISTATGIVVTRAASDGNLGDDIMKQLFAYPKLLYVVAATIGIMGLFTPIGLLRTLPVAGLMVYAGYNMQQNVRVKQVQEQRKEEEEVLIEPANPENVVNLLHIDPIEFEFGYSLIPLADANQGGDLLNRVVMIRRQCALELGIIVPVVRIRDNLQLKHNAYVIRIRGNQVAGGEIFHDHYLAISPGIEDESIHGIETTEPVFGLPALWIPEEMKEQAEFSGYTIIDPLSVVVTHLTEIIKKHAADLLGRQETKQLLDNLKQSSPAVVDELVPNIMGIGEVQKVLQKLLKEKISIRNLLTILETLADYGQYTKEVDTLCEYVRQALSRQITQQFSETGQPMYVVTVGPGLEKVISDSIQQTEHGRYLAVDPQTSQRIYEALKSQLDRLAKMRQNIVLLCSPAIRLYLRQFVERFMPEVAILSYNELEPHVEIQSVGVVNI